MRVKLIASTTALGALLFLGGCATPSEPAGGTAPGAGPDVPAVTCNAQAAQSAVGKPASASAVEQARQRSGALMARVLRPNQVVTMEFNGQRLNLDVDPAGVVLRLRCG